MGTNKDLRRATTLKREHVSILNEKLCSTSKERKEDDRKAPAIQETFPQD